MTIDAVGDNKATRMLTMKEASATDATALAQQMDLIEIEQKDNSKLMKAILAVTLGVSLLVGCADSINITQNMAAKKTVIPESTTVYIALPRDGSYGNTNYSGSGKTVASIIRAAFLKHLVDVDVGRDYQSYKQALASSASQPVDLLVYPSILHWEDRATEWSGIPDKASIKIVIYSLSDESVISSVTIDGTSGLATFGGDHPQDLLPEPVGTYVDSLF
ncbi:DUF4823 domain-containing protein [Shewanella sp.]|uniref:DUF4823 domain-containing protein n=1 Tax=Shewanella sp. TaxID=50422 RepID=UPI003A97F55C